MSDIRSPSTTPITSTSNIPPSLDISSTPSRTQVHETKDSPLNSQGSRTTPRRRTLSIEDNIHTGNKHRRTTDEDLLDQRPIKKMRRNHSEERAEEYEGRSSPSLSSHSGNGDHETEGERSQLSETSSAPTTFEFAVPKKKRTRTLTTPHQAAVLHALLAQVCGGISVLRSFETHIRPAVSLSDNSYAGGSRETNRVECAKSSGKYAMYCVQCLPNPDLCFRSGSKTSARRRGDPLYRMHRTFPIVTPPTDLNPIRLPPHQTTTTGSLMTPP